PMPNVKRVPGRLMTTASADVPLKGLTYLIEALAKIRTERDDAHLVVIGQPRHKSAVPAQIERLGLQGAIEFVSGVTDERIVELYAEAEIAVVPSLYEGFSLPAIEAMACGVPLVTTTGGALPEVVGPNGESAMTVPPGDSGALAQQLVDVLNDDGLRARLGEGRRRGCRRDARGRRRHLRAVGRCGQRRCARPAFPVERIRPRDRVRGARTRLGRRARTHRDLARAPSRRPDRGDRSDALARARR